MNQIDKYTHCAIAMELARAVHEDAWSRRTDIQSQRDAPSLENVRHEASARHKDYVLGLSDALNILSRYVGLPAMDVASPVAARLAEFRRTHLDDLLDYAPSEEDVVVADYTYLTQLDSLKTLVADATATMVPAYADVCRYILKVGEATDAQLAEALKSTGSGAVRKTAERAAAAFSRFFETSRSHLGYRVVLEKPSWGGPWCFVYHCDQPDLEVIPLVGRQLARVTEQELRRAERDQLSTSQQRQLDLPNLVLLERTVAIPSEADVLAPERCAEDLEHRMSIMRQSQVLEYVHHETLSESFKTTERYRNVMTSREVFRIPGQDHLKRIEVRLTPTSTEIVWNHHTDLALLDVVTREVARAANLRAFKTLDSTFTFSFESLGDHRSDYANAVAATGLPALGKIEFMPRVRYDPILQDSEFSKLLPSKSPGLQATEPYLTVFEFSVDPNWRSPGEVLTRLRMEAVVPWTRVEERDDHYLLAAIESTNRVIERHALEQYILPLACALGSPDRH